MESLSSGCLREVEAITIMKSHGSHPSFGHLVMLVFEAVMQVVCVSLPGYIIARLGHFDADKQKFLANLNVMLFTPCLSMCCFFVVVVFVAFCRIERFRV